MCLGAFFQDEDEGVLDNDLMKRDLNAPTGSDVWMNYDSEYLPKVMKVKNFGLASRTKCKHVFFVVFNSTFVEYALHRMVSKGPLPILTMFFFLRYAFGGSGYYPTATRRRF